MDCLQARTLRLRGQWTLRARTFKTYTTRAGLSLNSHPTTPINQTGETHRTPLRPNYHTPHTPSQRKHQPHTTLPSPSRECTRSLVPLCSSMCARAGGERCSPACWGLRKEDGLRLGYSKNLKLRNNLPILEVKLETMWENPEYPPPC